MYKQYFKQAWNLMKQNRFFSAVYIAGTGLAISMVMVIAIAVHIRTANIAPEVNRGRRLDVAVNLFLLVNVFLAVIGTFWFRVNRRRSELGLRMAVGSTRRNLQWLVIGEGLVMLTVVALPALVICLNLAFAGLIGTEVMEITFLRLLSVSLLTWAILAAVIILAVWYPSRKASRLEPAEALHYE